MSQWDGESETVAYPELICGDRCTVAGVLFNATEGECDKDNDVPTDGKELFNVC